MTKATTLDKNEVLTLINHYFDTFQNCINQHKNPNQAGFDKFLGNKFHITSNGANIANNLSDYLNRIELFQKKFTHCEIHLSTEDTVWADNHFACNYHVNLTEKSGKKITLCMMAIGTWDHDKITQWKQVVHEQGASHWEL